MNRIEMISTRQFQSSKVETGAGCSERELSETQGRTVRASTGWGHRYVCVSCRQEAPWLPWKVCLEWRLPLRSRGWAGQGPWLWARVMGPGVWDGCRTEGWCPELARNNMGKQGNISGSPPSSCARWPHHGVLATWHSKLGGGLGSTSEPCCRFRSWLSHFLAMWHETSAASPWASVSPTINRVVLKIISRSSNKLWLGTYYML